VGLPGVTPTAAPIAAARAASIPATARSGSSVECSRTTQRARGAMAMVGRGYPETKSGDPEGPPDERHEGHSKTSERIAWS
jgi:hypothetical protein